MKTPTFEEMTELVYIPNYGGWISRRRPYPPGWDKASDEEKETWELFSSYEVTMARTKEEYDRMIQEGFVPSPISLANIKAPTT